MTDNAPWRYEKHTVTYPDGEWAEVCTVGMPANALRFADITLTDHRVRVRDAARLRYYKAWRRGETEPMIVAWACLEADRPVNQVFPGLDATTSAGEHFLSANSLITYVLRTLLDQGWLRWQAGRWDVQAEDPVWQARGERIVNWLTAEQRLWLEVGPDRVPPVQTDFPGFAPLHNLIPVGRCGYVRDVARERMPRAVFNAAYFLLEHDDFLSHHSALGDPYGLLVDAGTIIRPPLYRRGAIWLAANGPWHVGRIGMADLKLRLPDGLTLTPEHIDAIDALPFQVNPAAAAAAAIYTRYFGVRQEGRVVGFTPAAPDRLELTVIDRRVVGWKQHGGLLIPQNGFVLSFAPGVLANHQWQALLATGKLAYSFAQDALQDIVHAVGCGPLLIEHGQSALTSTTFVDEEYWISREKIVGVVPTDYPDDIDRSRAARIGLGIDASGDLVAVAVNGTSKGLARSGQESAGATLIELAEQLLAAGAENAINLDGGGSTQVFVEGGLFNRPGDQRGWHGVFYERILPSVGIAP